MRTGIVIAMAVVVTGCATPPGTMNAEVRERKVYRTGSNLPVKDPDAQSRTQVGTPSSTPLPPVGMPPRGPGGG